MSSGLHTQKFGGLDYSIAKDSFETASKSTPQHNSYDSQPHRASQALVESFGLPTTLLSDPIKAKSDRPQPQSSFTTVKRRGRPCKNSTVADDKAVATKPSNAKRAHSASTPTTFLPNDAAGRPNKFRKIITSNDETAKSDTIETSTTTATQFERDGNLIASQIFRASQDNFSSNDSHELLSQYSNMLRNIDTSAAQAQNAFTSMLDNIFSFRGAHKGQHLQSNSQAHSRTSSIAEMHTSNNRPQDETDSLEASDKEDDALSNKSLTWQPLIAPTKIPTYPVITQQMVQPPMLSCEESQRTITAAQILAAGKMEMDNHGHPSVSDST